MEKQNVKEQKLNFDLDYNEIMFNHMNKNLHEHEVIPQPNSEPSTIDQKWLDNWQEIVDGIEYTEDYFASAKQLSAIIKTGMLKFTALRDEPEKFFSAHRAIAARATELGPGFFIRFTVQYNLFAGTILGIAGDEQLSVLDEMQEKGQLGCFGLTEKFAGVNSGLVVNTEIEWDNDKQHFILNTPNEGAEKNWISQGYTADKAVVIANLKIDGKVLGPHAFLMDFRDEEGTLVKNIKITDMGRKTVGNDLDNVAIHFDHCILPKSSMLNRFAEIDEDGNYKLMVPGIRPFDMIGQRLFSGRVAVAQAAASYQKSLFAMTKQYSDNKLCWGPKGKFPPLTKIPQLTEIYTLEAQSSKQMWTFLNNCEAQLCACLKENKLPKMKLIEAIAVCKVKAVEQAIEFCFKLKQEVGSYALMHGKGFEQMDFLQCCKFAEGDSRILMLKMGRDAMYKYKKALKKGVKLEENEETGICSKFGEIKKEDQFKEMSKLASLIMERYMKEFTQV